VRAPESPTNFGGAFSFSSHLEKIKT